MNTFARLPATAVTLVHPKTKATVEVGRPPVNLAFCSTLVADTCSIFFPGVQPELFPCVAFTMQGDLSLRWIFPAEGERDLVLEELLAMMPPPLICAPSVRKS